MLLLLVYASTYITLKEEKDFIAGLCLGLGLFRFQFVLPFALIFLFRRKGKFLGGFICSAALLGVLSLVAVGAHGVESYLGLILNVGNHPGNLSFGSAVDMGTLQGLLFAVMGRVVNPKILTLTVAGTSLLLLAFTGSRWRQIDVAGAREGNDVMFAAAVAVSLVTGAHMFMHDFSPMMLALLLALAHFPKLGRTALRVALGITLIIFWIPAIYFVLVPSHRLYLMSIVLLVFSFSSIAAAKNSMSMKVERVPV